MNFMEAAKPMQWGSVDDVVEEITRINKSLPVRPGIEEVEAAKTIIRNVDIETEGRLECIFRQTKVAIIPEELFLCLLEMQKAMTLFHAKEEKREALQLLDLEDTHALLDDFIQRASRCISSSSSSSSHSDSTIMPSSNSSSAYTGTPEPSSIAIPSQLSLDDGYRINSLKSKSFSFASDGIPTPSPGFESMRPFVNVAEAQEEEAKVSLIKLANVIEVAAKKGLKELCLSNKLLDKVEWLPDSIGKLTDLEILDLSENRIAAICPTMGSCSSLSKLDLHANRISQLPDSIGDLVSLKVLDVRANQLTSLPSTFDSLVGLQDLDVSSNCLSGLPDSIGSLFNLRRLIIETNNIEELPHSIGQCTSLLELRADYNRLKALPEAVGKIKSLEILSVRYNNIRQLPTTMSSLTKLQELDVSFNELEAVPESLCVVTTLVKLNVGNNFADLRYLPRSIGELENLEELDISNNQIHELPESFKFLTKLRVLLVDGNPLDVPPRTVAEKGPQAVVQYMDELGRKSVVKSQPVKQKKRWMPKCFPKFNKRKRGPVVMMNLQ